MTEQVLQKVKGRVSRGVNTSMAEMSDHGADLEGRKPVGYWWPLEKEGGRRADWWPRGLENVDRDLQDERAVSEFEMLKWSPMGPWE